MTNRELLLKALKKRLTAEKRRFDNLDYHVYPDLNVLDIPGSNELSDWGVNLMGLLKFPLGHPGYTINAKKLDELVTYLHSNGEINKDTVLVGHSYGAATINRYMARKDRFLNKAIVTAPPVSEPLFRKKNDNIEIFMKRDDPARLSGIFFWYFYPRCKWTWLPKTKSKRFVKDHLYDSYIEVLES